MKKALLGTVLSLCLAGCAFTTEQIDLVYAPLPGVSTAPGANNVLVRVQVNDQRQEKSKKVSSKKNGYGMETAPILANEEVTATLRGAIEQELQSRGFSIGNEALVLVIAEVTRFWNDHKKGFFSGTAVADLNMSIMVKNKNGNLLYSRQVIAQGVEPGIQLANGENARLALTRAMENGMRLLFDGHRRFRIRPRRKNNVSGRKSCAADLAATRRDLDVGGTLIRTPLDTLQRLPLEQ